MLLFAHWYIMWRGVVCACLLVYVSMFHQLPPVTVWYWGFIYPFHTHRIHFTIWVFIRFYVHLYTYYVSCIYWILIRVLVFLVNFCGTTFCKMFHLKMYPTQKIIFLDVWPNLFECKSNCVFTLLNCGPGSATKPNFDKKEKKHHPNIFGYGATAGCCCSCNTETINSMFKIFCSASIYFRYI